MVQKILGYKIEDFSSAIYRSIARHLEKLLSFTITLKNSSPSWLICSFEFIKKGDDPNYWCDIEINERVINAFKSEDIRTIEDLEKWLENNNIGFCYMRPLDRKKIIKI